MTSGRYFWKAAVQQSLLSRVLSLWQRIRTKIHERSIEFDQNMYYQAVRCNRQKVGKLSKWQNGVEKYTALGCGDVADLNCDHGLEWLALYTVKTRKKGEPILADSLTLVYGNTKGGAKAPGEKWRKLHYFNNMGGVNIAERAYCYNNADDKKEICFYWNVDTAA